MGGAQAASESTPGCLPPTPDRQLGLNSKKLLKADFAFNYSPPQGPKGSSIELRIRGRSKDGKNKKIWGPEAT
ncbi:hypothetical protein LTR84_001161 [Exophiala bonariae]|uniref:Uncharacterized protein n=1 Tax=Exophiala bonariae TaxID=1690606 RepID=A0AAV9NT22_9EURO|nr:hypothetical protein LTR84_001161 [Exophiala bonariae]